MDNDNIHAGCCLSSPALSLPLFHLVRQHTDPLMRQDIGHAWENCVLVQCSRNELNPLTQIVGNKQKTCMCRAGSPHNRVGIHEGQ
jgi:hypothetical protein